ncbi:uncharacterized protein LOC127291561 isoform X2 [Leptopilina boulardi]|uniref:uncharacterized protein LOC127291561 isoform X2 n=1 Tax=Leptopilina boulardi TaxID=63433 RepID=UPI0021F55D00|nr:uncharacterized protein LOC127291561 isoform X2 [Leptopilina boulardi]
MSAENQESITLRLGVTGAIATICSSSTTTTTTAATTITTTTTTRVKREKIDVDCNNVVVVAGDHGADVKTNMETYQQHHHHHQQQQQRAPATTTTTTTTTMPISTSPRVTSNGYHNEDVFRDVIAGKFANLQHNNTTTKHEKIRLMIEESIGDESKFRVQEIFSKVEQLKIEEKLLLYLKLPLSLANPSGTIDPLKQPLNPLGNRYEIHQTIMWIKTHLEEDPDVSLPKQEVYDEYNMFCVKNSMKPLSTADFGKVMKQVYPRVRPRRLGTRGNSRYCYAGMRKKIKLDQPKLPIIAGMPTDDNAEENITEEMLGAASTVIREWAENLLGLKFPTLSALGRYLVDNMFVDTRSLAAVCIVCDSGMTETVKNEISESPVDVKSGKLREAQLQLQRKLQQREHVRDQKQRQLENESPSQNKEKTVNNNKGGRKGSKKKTITNQSPQEIGVLTSIKGNTTPISRQKKTIRNQIDYVSQQSNCDNLVVQSIENVQKLTTDTTFPIKPRNPRKRTSGGTTPSQANNDSSPEKQAKHTDTITTSPSSNINNGTCTPINNHESGKIPVILANNRNKNFSKAADSQLPLKSCDIDSCAKLINGCSNNKNDEIPLLENSTLLQRTNLGTIDPDSLDDYLNGGNNSQEQEEELLQYFQHGESDPETVNLIPPVELSSRSDKVSELRFILQQNLKARPPPNNQTTSTPLNLPTTNKEIINEKQAPNTNVNIRRRVSFETSVIEHDSIITSHTVPQSPNTRRRIFNFTPISPGPHSPINGRASKCNSANASPFVSPRNTPVPRSKSNLQNGYRSRKKTLSRSISCSVPYTNKNETFIVPENTRQIAKSPLVVKSNDMQIVKNFVTEPQKQMIVNYQENLQEQLVKNIIYQDETKTIYQKTQQDQEISDLLDDGKYEIQLATKEQLYSRSQSVPLYRMVNPTLISPVSTTQFLAPFRSFNPSTSSSIAPTPVPSEFTDFYSIDAPDDAMYLLEDANFMSDDQQFLMGEKEMSSENINNFLNILNEEPEILCSSSNGQGVMETSSLILDGLPNSYLNMSNDSGMDSGIVIENEDSSGGSRSYPTTPLHSGVQARATGEQTYSESNEPMLSSPTIDTLNLRGDVTTTQGTNSSESVCQDVADLLEPSFLDNVENGDLDALDSFEGLQDALPPLFNEVVEPNR